jgi:large subunit ribosomal protein L6
MSRIGKIPIRLPKEVTVSVDETSVLIKGPFGASKIGLPNQILVEVKDLQIFVRVRDNSLKSRSVHGSVRTLLANGVYGVSKKFNIELQLVGVGYRCEVTKTVTTLRLGFSHPIHLAIPEEIEVMVENNTLIKISGPKKELISQFAAQIRSYRPPEPYNGKGVLYKDEKIIRKAGKSGKK